MPSPQENPTITRGRQRFQQFSMAVRRLSGDPLSGRLLDFGCGAGGFLSAAIDAGLDAFGVEVEPDREAQFKLYAPTSRHHRLLRYDGLLLPFDNRGFDTIYSWFVFEHVQQPTLSLREIVRVTRPGGMIHLYADDARNHWDGHVGIPFPAFMPRQFTHAYLEVFGLQQRTEFINDTVFYVTAPMIASVLRTLGCEIVYENTLDESRELSGAVDIASDEHARALAFVVKDRIARGLASPPKENLHIVARRMR